MSAPDKNMMFRNLSTLGVPDGVHRSAIFGESLPV